MEVKFVLLEVFFVFIILSLYASLTNAQNSTNCFVAKKQNCPEENRVLGMSNLTNAHVQAGIGYNQNITYPYVLCCSGSNTSCTGNNRIVKLSDITNSHVETPGKKDLNRVDIFKITDKYAACLNETAPQYNYCLNNNLPVLNKSRGYKFFDKDFNITIYPQTTKVYLSDITHITGLIGIDDKIIIITNLGTFEGYRDYFSTYVTEERVDITHLFQVNGTTIINISVNVKMYDVYGEAIGNPDLFIEQRNDTGEVGVYDYYFEICYGNLQCKSTTQECMNNETSLFSLSSETNAHVANGSAYPLRICCKSVNITIPITGGTYWADMLTKPINKAQTGDSVKLILNLTGIPQGTYNVNYSVYKTSDNTIIKIIRSILNALLGPSAQISAKGFGVWRTTESGSFYFKARIEETGQDFDSRSNANYGILEVEPNENNALPHAIIIKPEYESKHVINFDINFEQVSYDDDDDLNITWYFGDGQTAFFSNCQSTANCNVKHSYTNSGTKNIRLNAKEATRNQQADNYTRIFVYKEGINIFPVITSPAINEEISITSDTNINFNGNRSWVANCTILGTCHAPSGIECYNISEGNTNLTCFDLPKNEEWLTGGNPKYLLCFNWTIEKKEGETFVPIENKIGDWAHNYSSVVEFNLILQSSQYIAKLNAGYEPDTTKTCS